MCDHSPLTPELCKPSKAVRTTAKAYLKTTEKKLAQERARAEAAATPDISSARLGELAIPAQDGSTRGTESLSIAPTKPDIMNIEAAQEEADQPRPSIEVGHDSDISGFWNANGCKTPSQNEVPLSTKEIPSQDQTQNQPPRGLEEFPKDREETAQLGKQQVDPAGLGGCEDHSQMHESAADSGSGSNLNENINMMNPSNGFENGMDYNQMMQLMSGNMGNGMGNFNPMIGESDC